MSDPTPPSSSSSSSNPNGTPATPKPQSTTTTTVVTTHHPAPVVPPPPPVPAPVYQTTSTTHTYVPESKSFSITGFIFSIISGIVLLGITLFILAVVFVVLAGPGIIKKTVQEKTGFILAFSQFSINPFAGQVIIKNLELQNPFELGQGDMIKMPNATLQADLGSLFDKKQHIHLKEMTLHFSEINVIKHTNGQTNAMVFFTRLSGSTPTSGDTTTATPPASTQTSPSSSSPSTYSQKTPAPVIAIDHLHLIVDNISILDMTSNPPQATDLPLNLDYDRTNIANVADIRTDLTTQIIVAGAFNLPPQAILVLRNTLMGSTSGAATLTKNTLQTGVNVTENTTQKASEKISKAASSASKTIKKIFTKHAQTNP